MSTKFFLPVIHCIDPYQQGGVGHALRNTEIARKNGADGVFLIGHNMCADDLCRIYKEVRAQHFDFWIGVNFLDLNPRNHSFARFVNERCADANGLWVDQAPLQKLDVRQRVFAGVAFKYLNPNESGEELRLACEGIASRNETATTSGDKTGQPPTTEKLKMISSLLPPWTSLAVASGVNVKNVSAMKPFVDHFLVASSITQCDPSRDNHEYLAPGKVRELSDTIHS